MKKSRHLVYIISEQEVYSQSITWEEVALISNSGLGLNQYLSVLKPVLENDLKIPLSSSFSWEKLFEGLTHLNFTSKVPMFINYKMTEDNLKLFSAAIILYKLALWKIEDISSALTAYTYVSRMLGSTSIPQENSVILFVLRVMGRSMEESLLDKWIRRTKLSKDSRLLPHEFLFLMVNSEEGVDKIDEINQRFQRNYDKKKLKFFEDEDKDLGICIYPLRRDEAVRRKRALEGITKRTNLSTSYYCQIKSRKRDDDDLKSNPIMLSSNNITVEELSMNLSNTFNMKNLIKNDKSRSIKTPHLPARVRRRPKSNFFMLNLGISKDPFKYFMKSGKKLMRKLATSQTSRFKMRRNTNKLGLPEDKSKAPQPKKLEKIIK